MQEESFGHNDFKENIKLDMDFDMAGPQRNCIAYLYNRKCISQIYNACLLLSSKINPYGSIKSSLCSIICHNTTLSHRDAVGNKVLCTKHRYAEHSHAALNFLKRENLLPCVFLL